MSVRLVHVKLDGASTLRSAREVIADREVILVEVTDPLGNVGWGECSALPLPGYTAEYLDGCWAVLRDVFAPVVLGDPGGALEYLAGIPGHQMARHGMATALVDRELKARGTSLAVALADGQATAERVPSNAVIGICDAVAELEMAVARAVEDGHRSVKLKIDPTHDVAAVAAVRNVWPDLPMAVDANGSYPDADAAISALQAVERAAGQLSYVEQPVAADDLVGSAIVARRLETKVALDESVSCFGHAVTALSLGALGVLNVKPARMGGLVEAVAVARIVAEEGVEVFCGGMTESGVGRATALGFAAQPMCTLPCDLGPSRRYHQRDITRDFVLEDGFLTVPDGPGIGVEPDAAALAEHTVRTWSCP